MPSRASSLQLVMLSTSAPTPCCASCWAAILTEQGHPLPRLRTVRGKPVAPAQHTRRRIGRQVGLGAVLVHQGDVIKQALADIAALERFIIDQLTPIPGIEKIRTSFTLKQVRYKTALPLPETT